MYEVIYKFCDLQDEGHVYEIGDKYPREGYKTSGKRVKELSSASNKIGAPLIKAVAEEKEEE